MANRIDAGSLVCMSRRNVKGQGIALERVRDINLYAEFDLVDAWHKLYDKRHPEFMFPNPQHANVLWSLRSDVIGAIKEKIMKNNPKLDHELLRQFFSWNTAYSYQKGGEKITKLKTDFTLVRWHKPPSDYGDKACQWHKDKEIWHPTKLLKNV